MSESSECSERGTRGRAGLGVGGGIRGTSLGPPASRLVIIGWSMWLLASWWLTVGSGHAHGAIRAMLMTSLVGMMLLWPAWRLSQDDVAGCIDARFSLSPADVLVEWFCMVVLFQAVLLPLRMVARWSLAQALWLDAAVLGWTLLAGGIVAWGCCPGSGLRRSVAMLLCVVLLLGEPVVLALAGWTGMGGAGWALAFSPVQVVWNLSAPRGAWVGEPPVLHLVATGATALAGWVFAIRSRAGRLDALGVG